MRKDYRERYLLIIQRLRLCPCRFEDVKAYLLRSDYFQKVEVSKYSIRTLQRDIKYIESECDVIIRNKRGRDARYYILNETPDYI